jgi:hypothetical protein
MSTTDTGLVPYTFDQGFPDHDTAERVRNEQDLRHAIEAYRFFYPTVSFEGCMNGQREAGAEDNKSCIIMACGPRHVLFTGNSDTPYLGGNLDLKKGAMVVEVPAGPYIGILDDHNQRWIADLGIPGPDEGKGGKYLVLPPDHKTTAAAGYHVVQSHTYKVLLAMRAMPVNGDIDAALRSLKKVKVYPLAQAANPPAYGFIDVTERTNFDGTCLRWEDNLQYWQKLAEVIRFEPPLEEFRPMYGLLATLGIETGEAFAPDDRTNLILDSAAELGRDQLLVEAFASNRPERMTWPDRRWEWVTLRSENGDFEGPAGLDIQARERWFAQAIGASPAMTRRHVGTGSLYWLGLRDRSGAYLDGGKSYKLSVPTPVPAKLFWSLTVYDAKTRSQIQTDQDKAALRSLIERFSPHDGAIELYFGPRAPAGKEAQWIKTNPGAGWFSYFRIYGPEQSAFDGKWKLSDFEPL